tara:strand:- start:10308 stop:16598 length:6291 start_codon:yes stop_codon:yes gene_type:complete
MEQDYSKYLVKPEDVATVDENNLTTSDTITAEKKAAEMTPTQMRAARATQGDILKVDWDGNADVPTGMESMYGRTLHNTNYDDYAKYIDKPFSFISDDADDLRAHGQASADKWANGMLKFAGKTGTNILGSTVGLVYGAGAFGMGLFQEGSATKKFFDNDFQRGLDGINEYMDGALPNYYTKNEQDYNLLQSMGTANFWANDFTQGLSFIAGAVLAEGLTSGMASSAVAAKATKILQGASGAKTAGRMAKAADTAADTVKAADALMDAQRLKNGLVTIRQLGTGAMYESGVEARHHYDETLNHLKEQYKEEHGAYPPPEKLAGLADLATKSSNAVFAGNLALVGYGNFMMFPKIFGKGLNSTKGALGKTIKSELKGKVRTYKEVFKDLTKREATGRAVWKALKTPLYEGVVEEGGQKLLDLSGQGAAYDYYLSKRDASSLGMIKDLLLHTEDAFGDAYGSKEGQKEIGIGFLLAAMGLPGRATTTSKDGKTSKKLTWQGGVWGSIQDAKAQQEAITKLRKRLESMPNGMQAFSRNMDTLIRNQVIQDSKDFNTIIDNPFGVHNAEHDEIFNYVSSRIRAGFESELHEDIQHIRKMPLEEFRTAFQYNEKGDLTDNQLKQRRENIANKMEERIESISTTLTKLDQSFVNFGEDQKNAIAHALSIAENSDAREDSIISELGKLKFDVNIEVEEDKAAVDKREADESKLRLKNIWQRLSPKKKKAVLEDNAEAVEKVKKTLNIKELTDPSHIEELHRTLAEEQNELIQQIEEITADESLGEKEKEKKLLELGKKQEAGLLRSSELQKAINEGLDPYISAQEQKMLDAWTKANPLESAKSLEDVKTKLKDLRKLRARRHRAISMFNELQGLREEGAWNPKGWWKVWGMEQGELIPQPELLMQRMLDTTLYQSEDSGNKQLDRIYSNFKGKIVEFQYKNEKGETSTKRYYVTPGQLTSEGDKLLQPIPSFDTIALLKQKQDLQEELESLKAEEALLEDDDITLNVLSNAKARVQESLNSVEDTLAKHEHITDTSPTNVGFLLNASSPISVVNEAKIATESLEAVTKEINKKLSNKTSDLKLEIDSAVEMLKTDEALLDELLNKDVQTQEDVSVITKLQNGVTSIKKQILSLETALTEIEKDLSIIHNFSKKSLKVKTAGQARTLITTLFNESFESKDYSDLYKEILENSVYSMVVNKDKSSDTIVDLNKLQALKAELEETGEVTKEMLLKAKPSIKRLYNQLAKLEKALADIESAIKFRADGTPYKNTSAAKLADRRKALGELGIAKDKLEAAKEQYRDSLNDLYASVATISNVARDLNDHLIFTLNTIQEFQNPTPKAEELDEGVEATQNTIMTEGELAEAQQAFGKGKPFFSSAIGSHGLFKTATDQLTAERDLQELLDAQAANKDVDVSKVYALEAHLRFHAFLGAEDFTKPSTATKYKLMIVHRENVPSGISDDVFFYDSTGYSRGKALGQGEKSTLKSEENENIIFVVTDAKGAPITRLDKFGEAKPVYASMPTSNLTRSVTVNKKGAKMDVYRYGKSDLKPSTIKVVTDVNDVQHYTGDVLSTVQTSINAHKARRNEYLAMQEPEFIDIIGLNNPMVNKNTSAVKSLPSASIKNNTSQIDLRLNISKKGEARSSVYVGNNKSSMTLKAGMPYTHLNGKLVPMYNNMLSESSSETVFQLFKIAAKNHNRMLEGKMSPEQAKRVDPSDDKSSEIMHVLKNMVFFGPRTRGKSDNALQKSLRFELRYTESGFTVFYGDYGSITMQQLLEEEATMELSQLSEHIKTLRHNINRFSLAADITARKGGTEVEEWQKKLDAYTATLKKQKKPLSDKAIKYKQNMWMRKKKNERPSTAAENINYESFKEYRIDNKGKIETYDWTNYTDYLLGDGTGNFKRTNGNEIPLYSYLHDKISEKNKNFGRGAQFLNSYLLIGNKTMLKEDLKKKSEKEKATETEEETVINEEFEQEMQDLSDVVEKTVPKYDNKVITAKRGKTSLEFKIKYKNGIFEDFELLKHNSKVEDFSIKFEQGISEQLKDEDEAGVLRTLDKFFEEGEYVLPDLSEETSEETSEEAPDKSVKNKGKGRKQQVTNKTTTNENYC